MQKFNKKLKPVFLGLSISMLFSFNAHAGIDGWKFENNHWKYYKEAKSLKAWQHINNTWYFFNEDGSLKTGWYLDAGNNWYFLDSSKNVNQGALLTGWQWIDGYCYYFEGVDKARLGRMYANTAVDGYKLGTTGRWIDENGVEHYESGKGISTNTAGNNLKQKSLNTTGRSGGSGGGGSSRGGASGSGGSSRGAVSSKGGGSNGGGSAQGSEAGKAQASHDSILSQSDSSKKDGITGSSSQENEYGNLNNTVGNTFDNKDNPSKIISVQITPQKKTVPLQTIQILKVQTNRKWKIITTQIHSRRETKILFSPEIIKMRQLSRVGKVLKIKKTVIRKKTVYSLPHLPMRKNNRNKTTKIRMYRIIAIKLPKNRSRIS